MTLTSRLADTFRALRVRNVRPLAAGQVVSVAGTWMMVVARDWLVLCLTRCLRYGAGPGVPVTRPR